MTVELRPINNGYHSQLNYDLLSPTSSPTPSAGQILGGALAPLQCPLQKWTPQIERSDDDRFFYQISYGGISDLSLKGLKGKDPPMVQALKDWAAEAGVKVLLARLETVVETWKNVRDYCHRSPSYDADEADSDKEEEDDKGSEQREDQASYAITELVGLDGRVITTKFTFDEYYSWDNRLLQGEKAFGDLDNTEDGGGYWGPYGREVTSNMSGPTCSIMRSNSSTGVPRAQIS